MPLSVKYRVLDSSWDMNPSVITKHIISHKNTFGSGKSSVILGVKMTLDIVCYHSPFFRRWCVFVSSVQVLYCTSTLAHAEKGIDTGEDVQNMLIIK